MTLRELRRLRKYDLWSCWELTNGVCDGRGTGVGLIHEIRTAKEIVEEVRDGVKALLTTLPW